MAETMITSATHTSLANGVLVPCLRLGTFRARDDDVRKAVLCTLQCGYTHIAMEKEPLIPKRDIVNEYKGSISDVSSDGTVDYRGRPADKATFGRWKAASFILGAVILETLAYYGKASNLISYLTIKLHQGSAEAVTNVWIWGGVTWLTPLLGGFIADSFLFFQ